MEAPISASQGAMRSLPGKLESLLLEPPGRGLTKGEKNKIHHLKGDLEELIANYLMEPSEVDAPALTANCWVKEVRELSYDIDDFVKELVHADADAEIGVVRKTPRVKISRLRENLNRRRWIADEISGFRTRVKEAIELHRKYNLGSCSFRPWRTSDEQPLPPLYARLVHRDDLWDKLHGWLADDGEQQLRRVAAIVGIGGVGKTTLAKQVYDKLGGRFECRTFVRTSRKTDMRGLLASMLSQLLRRHEAPEADAAWEVRNLIDKIRAHLIHKKYFIIIDDLWATSTWDIVSLALPDNPCSRILLTTEFDIVAQMCCGYNSKYIFKMEPLSEDGSRELFFSRAFGHQHDCPEQLNEVSYEIIRKCGGLPLATITIASLLASQPNRIDQWNYIQNSLSSNLRTDPTLEGMQQVLNVSYNNLPHRLKACMLYLSMYRESHIIWKHDLVKQWTAEDFISVVEGEDMEEIAGSYFDELVKRGMIQPVDINYNGDVLSCAVHYIVLNFIRYKSIEENFVTAIDHSQTNVRLTNKVRRLSLHFGDAEDVTPPSLRLSQVRSVGFFGLFKCMPSILEFNFLQVLILQLWGDDYDKSYNVTEILKLFRLRYLRINAFHLSVQLPAQMQQLKDLVTLEIERRVTAVPSDIVDLPRLLHLSLPSETALPIGIGRMTSLRTLGYFDLNSNSKENVLNLGELTNLCDLRLTCSTVPSDNLEDNMQCLSTVLWKLSRLKSLTLAPEFSHTKTPDASVSSMSIFCDGLGSVSSPPTLLQRLELLPRICIFSSLPKWIRKLDRLSILRIAVRSLSLNDIDILKGLLALTALSLYVRTAPVERIVFDKPGFPILKYLRFMCTTPCLAFEEGAMPNVRRLKLGSNAHRAEQYGPVLSSIKYLLSLEVITVLIGGSDRTAAKPVLWDAITEHPSTPIVNIRYVDWIFYCEEEKIRATQEQEQPSLENQYENVEVDSDRQHGILEMNMGGDTNNQADCRISMSPESSSHLPSPGMSASKRAASSTTTGKLSTISTITFMPSTVSGVSIDDAYPEGQFLESPNLRIFTYAELKSATRNFRPDTLLGQGGFGMVYKGWVDEKTMNPSKSCTGMVVAVKKLNPECVQGMEQWLAEVNYLGRISHPNLVKLLGYSTDDNGLLLVYEFMARGSLENHLFRRGGGGAVYEPLPWSLRLKILIGAARGLAFLHSSETQIIYRDFKTSNILLDSHYNAKLSDFGLAKHGPDVGESHVTTRVMRTYGHAGPDVGESHVTTRVMRTYGHAAPEYVATGRLCVKSDVYSFGVVLLEMLSGLRALDPSRPSGKLNLVDWAKPLLADRRKLSELMDGRLGGQYHSRGARHAAQLTLKCLSGDPKSCPSMKEVVGALEQIETMKSKSREPRNSSSLLRGKGAFTKEE